MPNGTDKYTLEVLLKGLNKIQDLEKILEKATASTKTMDADFSRMLSKLSEANRKLQKLSTTQKQFSGVTRLTSRGTPETQTRAALARGAIADIRGTEKQLQFAVQNAMAGALKNFTKNIKTQAFLEAAGTRGRIVPGKTAAVVSEQVKAQEFRLLQARAQGSKQLIAQEKQGLIEIKAAQTELLSIKKAGEAVTRKVLTLNQRIKKSLADQVTLKTTKRGVVSVGTLKQERIKLLLKTNQLRIDRELVKTGQQNSATVDRLRRRQTQLLNIQKQLNVQKKTELSLQQRIAQSIQRSTLSQRARAADKSNLAATRSVREELILGDGGASLFKIQAQLLGNFLIMNKVFQLFSFGAQFVLDLDKAFRQLQAITATTETEMLSLSQSLVEV